MMNAYDYIMINFIHFDRRFVYIFDICIFELSSKANVQCSENIKSKANIES